jgi:hypothetical protein
MAALSYEYVPQTASDVSTTAGQAARAKAIEHAQLAKEVLVLRKRHVEVEEAVDGKVGKEGQEELEDIQQVMLELDEKVASAFHAFSKAHASS